MCTEIKYRQAFEIEIGQKVKDGEIFLTDANEKAQEFVDRGLLILQEMTKPYDFHLRCKMRHIQNLYGGAKVITVSVIATRTVQEDEVNMDNTVFSKIAKACDDWQKENQDVTIELSYATPRDRS